MPRTLRGFALILLAASLAGCASATSTAKSAPSTTPAAIASTTAVPPTAPPTFRSAPTTTTTRPPFFANPTKLKIGDRVTFAGRGCPPKYQVLVTINSGDGTLITVNPRADGSWTATTAIPDSTAVGTVGVSAWCQSRAVYLFSYKEMTVDVSTYRRLIVTPDVVHPGTTLNITGVGGCSVGRVYIELDADANGGRSIANSPINIGGSTNWHGQLLVPASAAPGAYELDTLCSAPRSFYAFWPVFPITVR